VFDFLFGRRNRRQERGPLEDSRAPRPRDRRRERVEREVYMIASRFAHTGGVHYDEENGDWLMIPNYPLPARWRQRRCNLLIVFPAGYPETPPIGFYLNRRFQLKSGGRDHHFAGQAYYGAADLREAGWHWYCVHIAAGAWQPQADHTKPDNMWTFLNMVRESLTNDF